MPSADVPPGASFRIYALPDNGPEYTKGTGFASFLNGISGGPTSGAGGSTGTGNEGPPNDGSTAESSEGDGSIGGFGGFGRSDDEDGNGNSGGDSGQGGSGGQSGNGGQGGSGGQGDQGGNGEQDGNAGQGDNNGTGGDLDQGAGGQQDEDQSQGGYQGQDQQQAGTGGAQNFIAVSPVRMALNLAKRAGVEQLFLAQVGSPAADGIGGGQTCGAAGGSPGKPAMSLSELTASLGLGPGGLPGEYRAGPDEASAPSNAPELVVAISPSDRRAVRKLVESLGGSILREDRLPRLGISSIVVDLAAAVSTSEFQAILAADGIEADVASNNLYGASQGRRVYANDLVGAVPIANCRLTTPVRIGLIDGPVDRTNPFLNGVDIRSYSALGEGETAGSTDHATGVASLLAAQPTPQGFGGIAPGAQLLSAEAFVAYSSRDAASVDRVAKSINWLLGQRASVINMSIAGPYNPVFRRVIAAASNRGAILVAASGNDGVAQVAYPGADPNVIAVTAVDAAKRPYAKANYGREIDFAAPGVDVLVAEGAGVVYRTGTSYASAVVSGMVAHRLATRRGPASVERLRNDLRETTVDLGSKGRDVRFGWGLARIPGC